MDKPEDVLGLLLFQRSLRDGEHLAVDLTAREIVGRTPLCQYVPTLGFQGLVADLVRQPPMHRLQRLPCPPILLRYAAFGMRTMP